MIGSRIEASHRVGASRHLVCSHCSARDRAERFMLSAARPSAGRPYDEFFEPDGAVAFGIGNIEIEQAFFP